MKHSRGFTLIEILTVLGVAAIVFALSLQVAEVRQARQNIDLTGIKVNLLNDALNAYYNRYCWAGTNPTPTSANLLSGGFIDSADTMISPYGANFGVSISWAPLPAYFEVSLTVASSQVSGLQNNLKPSRVVGTTLYWRGAPDADVFENDGQILELKTLYGSDCY